MSEKEIQTEQKILDAARKVFQRSGIGGARMQEIADEAGINKAALHYYFRSKEKLFQKVFREDFRRFMTPLFIILRDPTLSIEGRIKTFIAAYNETMIRNLHLPLFILHELSRSPDRLVLLMKDNTGFKTDDGDAPAGSSLPSVFEQQIRDGIACGDFHEVDPEQFIISLIGMCVFPFAGRPMIKFIFNKNENQYREFMQQRQHEITDYAFRILIKNYHSGAPGISVEKAGSDGPEPGL